jgi:hypothetical protein
MVNSALTLVTGPQQYGPACGADGAGLETGTEGRGMLVLSTAPPAETLKKKRIRHDTG